jgi:hypothetical protein
MPEGFCYLSNVYAGAPMEPHMAAPAQMKFISFAGRKGLAVVFGMSVNRAFSLATCITLRRAFEKPGGPLSTEPLLRPLALLSGKSVIFDHPHLPYRS